MAMKKGMACEGGCCGMHLCNQCAIPNVIFGLLLIIAGFGIWVGAPMWFNLETIIGVYLAVWGLFALLLKK